MRVADAATGRRERWDGVLPAMWLPAEWAHGEDAPNRFRLSDLPDDTPIADLVPLAKIRRRVEHDSRELKHGLGLHHFEGCPWPGWHHHATQVTAAHAFQPSGGRPKADTPDSPSTRSSTPSRTC